MASRKRNGGPRDQTTEILLSIRDEMRQMRSGLDETNAHLARLEKRQREDATRLVTELVAVA